MKECSLVYNVCYVYFAQCSNDAKHKRTIYNMFRDTCSLVLHHIVHQRWPTYILRNKIVPRLTVKCYILTELCKRARIIKHYYLLRSVSCFLLAYMFSVITIFIVLCEYANNNEDNNNNNTNKNNDKNND